MKKNLTDLNILVDRSASMAGIAPAVRSGIKELIQSQKKLDGECNITVAQFDRDVTGPPVWAPTSNKQDPFMPQGFGDSKVTSQVVDYLCEGVPLNVIADSVLDEYQPRGNTPLLEALRDFIARIGQRLRDTPDAERPEKVIVVVQTDGQENSSIGVNLGALKEQVQHQEQKYGWSFAFLGANIDAFGTSGGLGINMAGTLQYSPTNEGVTRAYGSTSMAVSGMRCGAINTMCFSGDDQEKQDDLGARPGILGVPSS